MSRPKKESRFDYELNAYVGSQYIVSEGEGNLLRVTHLQWSKQKQLEEKNFKQMVFGMLTEGYTEQELKEMLVLNFVEFRKN